MADIMFVRDGQSTFQEVIAAIPEPMRGSMEPQLRQMLYGKVGDVDVDGDVIKNWIKEDIPEPQKGLLMAALGMVAEPAEAEQAAPAELEQAAPAELEQAVTEFEASWEGAAEAMFERMLEEVPAALRATFRGKLMEVAVAMAGDGPITEDHIRDIVVEKVPDPFKTNILKAYATMGGVDLSRVEQILEETWKQRDGILAVLHGIQGEFGYCPEEALVLVSQRTSVTLSELYRLVSNYQAFSTTPPKKHNITVCLCTGCYVKGAGKILADLRERLQQNGCEVDLQTVRGLGCCNISPAILIDGAVYSADQASSKIDEVFGD